MSVNDVIGSPFLEACLAASNSHQESYKESEWVLRGAEKDASPAGTYWGENDEGAQHHSGIWGIDTHNINDPTADVYRRLKYHEKGNVILPSDPPPMHNDLGEKGTTNIRYVSLFISSQLNAVRVGRNCHNDKKGRGRYESSKDLVYSSLSLLSLYPSILDKKGSSK